MLLCKRSYYFLELRIQGFSWSLFTNLVLVFETTLYERLQFNGRSFTRRFSFSDVFIRGFIRCITRVFRDIFEFDASFRSNPFFKSSIWGWLDDLRYVSDTYQRVFRKALLKYGPRFQITLLLWASVQRLVC